MLETHCDQNFVPVIDICFWGLQACLLYQQMKKVFICSAWPSGVITEMLADSRLGHEVCPHEGPIGP